MKKVIMGALALTLAGTVVSCKKEAKTESSVSTDSLATVQPKDSVVAPKTDSASVAAPSKTAAVEIITKNDGKYPHDVKLFEDKNLTERLKKLVGKDYDEMIKNFNVESPIVSEGGIYKLHGCKQHDCPGYATFVYYDSKNDNLNVSIDKNGKATEFAEKGKITISKTLDTK
ncbi:hypothetical protein H5J24_17415 [Chryseobacterium capnotolerans]|uniref:hypothetical protein n=1 Tax=Chryseobacterium TaxID=59732 RepID=UPI00083AE605|nr:MULTISPECIES: hypothetical protein [Chryseobacterium]UHO37465.1 hypothetical protein H5J24_17415 [Chryseobacterium capnotolerans]